MAEQNDIAVQNVAGQRSNLPEFSVSEISNALKQTVEGAFSYVRVRGEISGFKRAASGHMYMDLKDDAAILNGVCWKGNAGKLSIKPEDGMDVICTGRLTTYPGRSNYQIVIESMELAGEGALLKLLEERKKKLASAGYFDASRKKPLPFLPKRIGVVTSPTGAVIRDILHRLRDRFPRHVLIWPAKVQGDGATDDIETAITGFNSLPDTQRPDLLIVARGGGSLEDLMCFNEENVVMAVVHSDIPVITAVGHETDTTLVDYASDLRAPTPTGAAELAVPRRDQLLAQLLDNEKRLLSTVNRTLDQFKERIHSFSRGLKDPLRLLEQKQQSFDHLVQKLSATFERGITQRKTQLVETASKLRHPREQITLAKERLTSLSSILYNAKLRGVEAKSERLAGLSRMLESLSFERVLDRGYAVVFNAENTPISSPKNVKNGDVLKIQFKDKKTLDTISGKDIKTRSSKPSKTVKKTDQGDLF